MNNEFFTNFVYIISSVLFAFGLKFLGSPVTARRGNMLSALGMFLAVLATLVSGHIISFQWILIGIIIGASLGRLSCFQSGHDPDAGNDRSFTWLRGHGQRLCWLDSLSCAWRD